MIAASFGRLHRAWNSSVDPAKARAIVLALGLGVFAAKVVVALRTFGTNDVQTFMDFAHAVRTHGPVGVYSVNFRALPGHWLYNHPPLMGYLLQFTNLLSDHGVPLRVTLRTASSAVDVVSGLLVYEILRRRTSLLRATFSGAAVAASPLLFMISGFHGNTDPIFLMLVMLGSFLIIDTSLSLAGGVALALALGIKVVAFVALPVLAVYLVVHHREKLLAATAGFLVTLGVTWGPAVIQQWRPIQRNVLGYKGLGSQAWGVVRFGDSVRWSPRITHYLIHTGPHIIPVACALVPALVAWRLKEKAMEAVALSFVATLVLLPGYAIQYLSWGVAFSYLLDPFTATIYSVLGGLVTLRVYDYWARGHWADVAKARTNTPNTIWLLGLLWASLIAVLITGVRRFRSPVPAAAPSTTTATLQRPVEEESGVAT